MDKVITVFAIVKAKEGCMDTLDGYLEKLIEETRKEEGCIDYILHKDIEDENVFIFYENWKNIKALEDHAKTSHFLSFVEKTKDLVVDMKIYKANAV